MTFDSISPSTAKVVSQGAEYSFKSQPLYFQGLGFTWGTKVYNQEERDYSVRSWVAIGSQHPTLR